MPSTTANDLLRFVLLVSVALGCKRASEPEPTKPVAAPEQKPRVGAKHVVAIGDLHGDLVATRRAFRLAGAIDATDAWIGGPLVVVQTGDVLDRGDDDRAILDWTDRLREAARAKGGDVILLSGNHEVMNVARDFRYVTKGAFDAFADAAPVDLLLAQPRGPAGRAHAFTPGQLYAVKLAARPIWARVDDTVFVHGGILPKHVEYGLDRMRDEVASWMRGERPAPPPIVVAEDGPIWTRAYSTPGQEDCASLERALSALGATRMVVGHTVQEHGITSACSGRVYRIDVGLSKFYGGPTQVLDLGAEGPVVKKEP